MTFAEAKDQAAQNKKFRDWVEMQNDFYEDRDWMGLESALDEAGLLLEQHAASVRDAGYKEGYTDAYDGRPHKFAVQKDWGDELPY